MPFLSFLRFRYVHPFRINIYYHTATTVRCLGKWSSSSFMLIKLRRFPRRHLELLGQLAVAALSRSLSPFYSLTVILRCFRLLQNALRCLCCCCCCFRCCYCIRILTKELFFACSLCVCVVVCFVRQLLAAVAVAAAAPFVLSLYLTLSLSLFAPQILRLSFALLTTVVVAFVVLANVVTVLLLLVVFSLPRKISFVYLCICQAFCAAGDCSALASTSSFSSSPSSLSSSYVQMLLKLYRQYAGKVPPKHLQTDTHTNTTKSSSF